MRPATRSPMKQRAEDYYRALSGDYASKIRQLVPKYDDMIACIADLVATLSPATLLDLGGGVGELEEVLLRRSAHVRITSLDACEEMVAEAHRRLEWAADRVEIVQQDILQFDPPGPFEAVVSNLVIHNLPLDTKAALLASVVTWLRPGGRFLWGDFIRHADPAIDDHFVRERKAFAVEAGCPDDLVAENFAKEREADFPLTVDETLLTARAAGFANTQVVWLHDTFAVFCLTTGVR